MDWERFNDQFRETESERAECWQCAKLVAQCECPNVQHIMCDR
jgi:hypothetical protein